jgi:hypothetical protein
MKKMLHANLWRLRGEGDSRERAFHIPSAVCPVMMSPEQKRRQVL